MIAERNAYIKALQEINEVIVEKRRIAEEYGRRGDRGYGDVRRVNWSLAKAFEMEAGDVAETLRGASARWPWPLLREPSGAIPNDWPYNSYECERCFHVGMDRTLTPVPTCQRCGAAVEHWLL